MEFLRAAHASGPDAPKPTPVEVFVASHPATLEFLQVPKPFPVSFAKESFYAVSAYKFLNKDGAGQYGRYRIRPDGGNEYLDAAAAAAKGPNFLFEDIKERLAKDSVRMSIAVQLAAKEDTVNDSTVHWPKDRPEVELGSIELTGVAPNNDEEQRHIIFDPIPRVNGIEPSEDPLLQPRADTYLMSGRRRRASGGK